jgi:hypothetical protein
MRIVKMINLDGDLNCRHRMRESFFSNFVVRIVKENIYEIHMYQAARSLIANHLKNINPYREELHT